MWSKKKQTNASSARIDSLIGVNTELHGDILFSGGLHVDGKVIGNVIAESAEQSSTLILSSQGIIEGEVRVAHVVLNGTVKGDVYSAESVELASEARVQGNVYYNLLEMAMGAEVNGNLVHKVAGEHVSPSKTTEKSQEEVVESTIMGYFDEKTQS
jgi:cytoskeletal protein CcmA (bactofilin family)